MQVNPVDLAKALVAIPSVSQWSNADISAHLEAVLHGLAFDIERLEYVDENGEHKVSLVAKLGPGGGGLAFISHTDTVPGQEEDWQPFLPVVENERLIGRGSCDMKGPLAATIAAAANIDAARLKRPVYIVIAADEEVGGLGAQQIAAESKLFRDNGPQYGVIAEPTQLIPVYAHKGGCFLTVTAHGQAAHTSTDQGISSNFLIAPFLAEMAELAQRLKRDESFMNHEFSPPTLGFNLVLNDGGCRPNVTAPKTECIISFRPMPDDGSATLIEMITASAERHGFEITSRLRTPFYTPPDAAVVQAACRASNHSQPQTVPFGTDAFHLKDSLELVVLGPGNIAQAHTVGEWITLEQLHSAVDIYQRMIEMMCM